MTVHRITASVTAHSKVMIKTLVNVAVKCHFDFNNTEKTLEMLPC
jgi:hypothetical protein